RLAERQEERAEAAHPVARVTPVESRPVPVLRLQLLQPLIRPLAELFQRPELDRVRRASLRAGRLVAALQPVVAERALPDAPVLLLAEQRQQQLLLLPPGRGQVPLVEHAERTGRHAVAAPVAHVLLDDDRAELRPEQGARRAYVEAGRVRAVLADVRGHEPTQ